VRFAEVFAIAHLDITGNLFKKVIGRRKKTMVEMTVPVGTVTIPITDYRELIEENIQKENLLDEILRYCTRETYIQRKAILEMLGAEESLDE
jgi:DNA-directed RNA polymerase subunit N (RpoN/RPB10)